MSEIESAIVGYLSGLLVGSLIVLVMVGFIYLEATNQDVPDFVSDIENFALEYKQGNDSVFMLAFALGFLSGIGGSSKAVS